jgi:hypothetical protein
MGSMFSLASILRIAFTSILSSVAFDIGWYGIGNVWVLVGGLSALVLAVAIGWQVINRWQTTGYKRISDKVKLASTVGTRADGTQVRAPRDETSAASVPAAGARRPAMQAPGASPR